MTFTSKQSQVKVIEHLFRLKNDEPTKNVISVDVDMTIDQKQHYKILVTKAKEKTTASLNNKKICGKRYIHTFHSRKGCMNQNN